MKAHPALSLMLLAAVLQTAKGNALEHPPPGIVLNPTGRVINMPVPVRKGDTVVGEIVVSIDEHDQVLIAATDLEPYLSRDLPNSLDPMGTAPVPVSLFSQVEGLEVDFDRLAMELRVKLAADKSKPTDLSFTGHRAQATYDTPATVSAFLNYTVSLTQDWQWPEASEVTLDLESALRVGSVVLEAEGSLGGALNGFLCPIEATCLEQEENAFRRRGTRAVYDDPDWDTRAIVGDTGYRGLPGQRSFDLLGISLNHDPDLFGKPQRQSTRSFNRLLVVERSADLELIINGVSMQRLKLQPGGYSLNDLPVQLGANSIQAIITYDNGEREVYEFNTLSSYQLLDAGAFTWEMTGGLPSTWRDGEREYLDIFQGGAFARYGFTDSFTGYVSAQTDTTVHTTGIGFHLLLPLGSLHLGGSMGFGDAIGYAVTASYETLPTPDDPYSAFKLTVDYTSPEYRQPGDAQLMDTDILYPVVDSWLRLSAFHSKPLFSEIYATTTARYTFATDTANIPGAVSTGIDRWSVDMAISRVIFGTTTISATAGYGNDRLLSFSHLKEEPELRFGIGLHARWGETSVAARHSFGNDVSDVTASHLMRTPSSAWQTSITGNNAPSRGLYSSASMSYFGQRGETRLSHTHQQPHEHDDIHRTQVQHSGAIAFADGKLALGAPVRNGFAIVYPHESISDSTVIVGNPEARRADGGSWFPAIITDLPAYGPVQYPLDATNVPAGYSLGTSHLNVNAPYRAGYAIALGSEMAVTITGTLLDTYGNPVALQSAKATSPAHPGKSVTLFTNSVGRFAAEGLAPGPWSITIASVVYSISIPERTRGLFNTDKLMPDGTVSTEPPDQWPATLLTEAQ